MVSPEMRKALDEVASTSDKVEAYKSILASLEASAPTSPVSPDDINALSDTIFDGNLGIVGLRAALLQLIAVLSAIKVTDTQIAAGNHILELLTSTSQASSFEEQTAQLRSLIATAHENDEDFQAAATMLAGIPLDSSQRKITPEEKARCWIRIVRNYLEVDDTTSAETYLNKFKNITHQVVDPESMLHFQLSQARVQDARRDFLAASKGYQDISLIPSIAEEERSQTLSMAIKCAILAPAGPQRGLALKRLYTDERSSTLPEWAILEKTFLHRLIAQTEIEQFAEGLMPHQLARTADGSTVLIKAMGEHNLLSASRLYSNIGFDELGELLGVTGDRAESMTAGMIESGRLVGRIDQIDRIIFFEGGEASGKKGSGRVEAVVGRELRRWDANVQGISEEVEAITTQLQTSYPVSALICRYG